MTERYRIFRAIFNIVTLCFGLVAIGSLVDYLVAIPVDPEFAGSVRMFVLELPPATLPGLAMIALFTLILFTTRGRRDRAPRLK